MGFHILSCGLIWTPYDGVLRPTDGSIAYMASGAPEDLDRLSPTSSSSSSEFTFLEGGAIVSRDCLSGAKRWRTSTLPPSATASAWQPPVAIHSHHSSSTCRVDAVTVSFGETGGYRAPIVYHAKTV